MTANHHTEASYENSLIALFQSLNQQRKGRKIWKVARNLYDSRALISTIFCFQLKISRNNFVVCENLCTFARFY